MARPPRNPRPFTIQAELEGQSLAQVLKGLLPEQSWSQVKRLISGRRVRVNGALCLDEGRRLTAGEVVAVCGQAQAKPPSEADVRIVYMDAQVVVVDKPAGIITERRHEEQDWPQERKARQPALEEVLQGLVGWQWRRTSQGPGRTVGGSPRRRPQPAVGPSPAPRVRAVHRLDRDTSGLMLFALSAEAQQALVRMFAGHEVERTYRAVVQGHPRAQTIETWLVRDRGDGLRGSSARGPKDPQAERAVTHLKPIEHVGPYGVVECRLETGRTHQIRIHLCETGHMLCGEKTYTHRLGEPPRPDTSGAPRQALHSTELKFVHPITGQRMRFASPWPRDLASWLQALREREWQ